LRQTILSTVGAVMPVITDVYVGPAWA